MKIDCIIQARRGSTRLPDKVLMKIQGKEMLLHVIERVRRSSRIDSVIVATTKKDDLIVDVVAKLADPKVSTFQGSEEDVLDRYYQAAKAAGSEGIVRITADCPLIDWTLIDKAVEEFERGDYDYVSNVLDRRTYPRGLDVEVFSFNVLEKMWKLCREDREREHVTTYIRENIQEFKTKSLINEKDLSSLRWTVDEESDFLFVERVYDTLYEKDGSFSTHDILELLKEDPELSQINSGVEQKKNIKNDAN